MRRWASWSLVGWWALLAPAPARAQSDAPPVPTPVSVRLHGEAPGLRLQVYPESPPEDSDEDRPIVTCAGDCRLALSPGAYRLKFDAPNDRGEIFFQVTEDSDLAVKTSSLVRRRVGLIMGGTGSAFSFWGGLGLVLVSMGALAHSDNSTCRTDECEQAWSRYYLRWQKTFGVLFLAGLGPMVVGWIIYACNKRPSVTVTPTQKQTSLLGAPQIGPVRILGAWGIGGSISF